MAHASGSPAPASFGSGNPRVLGVAGGGLKDASFLRGKKDASITAKVGQGGEEKTAALLNPLAAPEDGPTVLHDLNFPSAKYKANIDHALVAGSTVHLLDSKVWKPGFYLTVGGKTFRGGKRFAPAEKQTMVVAKQAVEAYLASLGITAKVATPTLLIWPSSTRKRLSIAFLKVPGARCLSPKRFESAMRRAAKAGAADPAIVAALADLLVTKPAGWHPGRVTDAVRQAAHPQAAPSPAPSPALRTNTPVAPPVAQPTNPANPDPSRPAPFWQPSGIDPDTLPQRHYVTDPTATRPVSSPAPHPSLADDLDIGPSAGPSGFPGSVAATPLAAQQNQAPSPSVPTPPNPAEDIAGWDPFA